MRLRRAAERERYDVAVIGSGLGGLSAAALLARAGKRVLVAERHDRPGGYAHAFRRRAFHFDSAVHLVGGCGPSTDGRPGLVQRVLDATGASAELDFARIDPVYSARFPDFEVRAPTGLEPFERVHVELFPRERRGIRAFLSECERLRDELEAARALASPLDAVHAPSRFPTLLRHRRSTLARALDEHLTDPRAKAALSAIWPYLGLPPSQVSFLYFASSLLSYIDEGAFYCRGTFQKMAAALVGSVERAGGEVLFRSAVRRIEVEDGRAAAIVLESGQRVGAGAIVSNADLRQTAEELVGLEHFPAAWRRRLAKLSPSVSALVVYLATRLDPRDAGLGHETFFFESDDPELSWRGVEAGRPEWWTITVPTLSDPSLAPAGVHLATLTTLIPFASSRSWRSDKRAHVQRLLERAARVWPGLRDSLEFCVGGTPRTFERYTRNASGALYGFALSPAQVGPARPAHATPLPGLYLAGHWSQPGGGVYGVVASGIGAARAVLGLKSDAELWAELDR